MSIASSSAVVGRRNARRPKLFANAVAQDISAAVVVVLQFPVSVARFATAAFASASETSTYFSACSDDTVKMPALLLNPSVTSSAGRSFTGAVSTFKRFLTVFAYSNFVNRRSGVGATAVDGQASAVPTAPP